MSDVWYQIMGGVRMCDGGGHNTLNICSYLLPGLGIINAQITQFALQTHHKSRKNGPEPVGDISAGLGLVALGVRRTGGLPRWLIRDISPSW